MPESKGSWARGQAEGQWQGHQNRATGCSLSSTPGSPSQLEQTGCWGRTPLTGDLCSEPLPGAAFYRRLSPPSPAPCVFHTRYTALPDSADRGGPLGTCTFL